MTLALTASDAESAASRWAAATPKGIPRARDRCEVCFNGEVRSPQGTLAIDRLWIHRASS